MRKLTGAVTAVLVLAGAPAAFGQGTASDNSTAQATVLTAVTVTAQRDLDFGNVIPGTNKAVAITAGTSGQWLVQGSGGAEVDLSFPVLPTQLQDGGVNTMPIAFSSTDAGHNTTNDAVTATAFDPAAGSLANIGAAPAELWVWIGGTVQPAVGQAAGLYQATITMQASYTGN